MKFNLNFLNILTNNDIFRKKFRTSKKKYEKELFESSLQTENVNDFIVKNNLYSLENDSIFFSRNNEGILTIPIRSDTSGHRCLCYFYKGATYAPHSHDGEYEVFLLYGKILYKNPITQKEEHLTSGGYYYNPPHTQHEWFV